MAWSYWLCDTVTGQRLAPIEPVAGSFQRRLNSVGQGQHTLLTSSIGSGPTIAARRESRRGLTEEWARTLVQCWDDVPVYAGIITDHDRNRESGQVTLQHEEFRTLLNRRTMFDYHGYGNQVGGARQTIASLTLAAAAQAVVRSGFRTSAGPYDYDVPLVIQSVVGPGPSQHSWWNYNVPGVETELASIEDEQGGPDTDFFPRWNANGDLEWLMRSGVLTGPTLDLNLATPDSPVTRVRNQSDAKKQANVVHVLGEGQEEDMKASTARITSPKARYSSSRMPKLERVEVYSQQGEQAILNRLSASMVSTYRDPTSQDGLSIRADGKPGVLDLELGQTFRVYSRDDDWMPDGWTNRRLIGFDGGIDRTVTLQVQPEGGGA